MEVVKALRKIGADVLRLNFPCDLMVRFKGSLYLLEVSNPENKYRKRDQQQLEFLRDWDVPLVKSADQALRAVGAVDQSKCST